MAWHRVVLRGEGGGGQRQIVAKALVVGIVVGIVVVVGTVGAENNTSNVPFGYRWEREDSRL